MNNKTTTGFGFCLKVSKMFWNFLMLSASVVNSNLDLNQITTKIIVSSPIFSSPPENITGFLTTTVFKVCKTLLYAIEISLMSSRMGLDLAPGLTLSFILSSTCRSINGYCWTVRQTWWKSGGGEGRDEGIDCGGLASQSGHTVLYHTSCCGKLTDISLCLYQRKSNSE